MTCALVKPTAGYRTFSRFVSLRVRSSITTSTDVSLGNFAHHLSGGLVRSQSLEGRRAQLPGFGPLHELELSHQLGLDEMNALRRRAAIEWARLALERLHQLAQLLERRVGEAGADLACVYELAIVVVADEDRTRQTSALALAIQPTADDELLAHAVLDLHPQTAAPARFVRRVQLLAHDAFEARLAARLEHGRPASLLVRRRLPRGSFELQPLQRLAPARVRFLEQRVPVAPHDVEKHVRDGDFLHLSSNLRLGGQPHALLDLLEARAALLIEGDDLSVEDDLGRAQRAAHRMYLWIARRDVLAAAAQQPDDSAIDVCLRADAIPLELKAPHIVGRRRFAHDLGEHRLDALRQRLPIRILGRIHAVDHPILAIGLEEHVPALHSLSVQRDHDLAIRPLLGLVRTAVPDLHGATAVLALWDLTREVDVVQRVVLDVDGEVVLLGVRRDSSGHGPRDKYPILLEPEIPVQASRGMLLHHEPRRLCDLLWHLGAGFRRFLEIPLSFVLGELFRHSKRLGHRGLDLGRMVGIAREAAPAEGEPTDGHIQGLQLQDQDAFGQAGHPVPHASQAECL